MTRAGRLAATVAATGAMALAAGGLTATASADLNLGQSGGYSYFQDTVTSSGEFTVDTDCPSNRHVLGMGVVGIIIGLQAKDTSDAGHLADDRVIFQTYSTPTDDADAYAICGRQTPIYKKKTKPLDPAQTRIVKARCPAGTRVTGGGGLIKDARDGPGQAYLNSSFPYDAGDVDLRADDGWAVRARNNTPATPGLLTAQAICVDHIAPEYVETPVLLPPNGGTSPSVSCPDTHQITGIGLESTGPADVGLTYELRPADNAMGDADPVPDDFGNTSVTNSSGASPPATARGICLN
jgi:hypothetical protein